MTGAKRSVGGGFGGISKAGLGVGCGVSFGLHLIAVIVMAETRSRGWELATATPTEETDALAVVDVATLTDVALAFTTVEEPPPPAPPPKPAPKAPRKVRLPKAAADASVALAPPEIASPPPFEDVVGEEPEMPPSDPPPPPVVTESQPERPVDPPAKAVEVPAGVARELRVYDAFPSMPESIRRRGFAQAVHIEVCVSEQGGVSNVTLNDGAAPALEDALRSAIRTWRYRPLIVAGFAKPFCHAMEIKYVMN
jgi:outer membrane biosynthesis protein TonB